MYSAFSWAGVSTAATAWLSDARPVLMFVGGIAIALALSSLLLRLFGAGSAGSDRGVDYGSYESPRGGN